MKLLKVFLGFLLATLWVQTISAYDFTIDGIYYNRNSDGNSVSVTYSPNNNNLSGNLIIPEKVIYNRATYYVTEIEEWALSESKISSVTLPNTIKSIGDHAFHYSSLKSIIIPNSITKIGVATFADCVMLEAIKIPNSVTSIGLSAFSFCLSLRTVEISDAVTSIGRHAFYNCSKLNTVVIGKSVKEIDDEAFAYTKILFLYAKMPDPKEIKYGINVFQNVPKQCKLLVMPEKIGIYRSTYPWTRFKENISDL